VLENGCRTCHKPYDENEIALQEFVHHNIDKTRVSSMIYGGRNHGKKGLGSLSSSDKENSSQIVYLNKPPSGLYSTFVKGSSEPMTVSDTLMTLEPQDKVSKDNSSSEP
jgi:hypothetical protein